MPSTTVHVKNISKQTDESQIRDFFSFCGKISDLKVSPSDDSTSQSATVSFEKETAARTALLLDNTQLGPNQVQVTSDDSKSLDDLSKDASAAPGIDSDSKKDASGNPDTVTQEDKPRSRIVAEYLANGYTISDKAIERAIALDKQHGISARFIATLKDFDQRYLQSGERARAADNRFGVTGKAAEAWRGMHSYFDRVLETPTGRQLRSFYETGEKQVLDVHNEARHLADLKSGKKPSSEDDSSCKCEDDRTTCACAGQTVSCPCEQGRCACDNCAKNPDVMRGTTELVQETDKTAVPGVDKSA